MFLASVHRLNSPEYTKMSHLKTLLSGRAKSAILGMDYLGVFLH